MGLMSDQETASALFDEVVRLRDENARLHLTNAALYDQHQTLGRDWIAARDMALAAKAENKRLLHKADQWRQQSLENARAADALAAENAQLREELRAYRVELTRNLTE